MAGCELTERAGAHLQLSTRNLATAPLLRVRQCPDALSCSSPKTKSLLRVGFRNCLAR